MITPTVFATPRFYDKKVQEINTELSTLSWLESVFPVTFRGEDTEGTYPEAYLNDGSKTSVRVLPSGNSVSFFRIRGAAQLDESDHFKTDLSLYVWADLTKADTTKLYNYRADMINDCRRVLNRHSCYDYSVDTKDVFNGFSQLEKLVNQNTMLPNTAFRIDFSVDLLIGLSTDTALTIPTYLLINSTDNLLINSTDILTI